MPTGWLVDMKRIITDTCFVEVYLKLKSYDIVLLVLDSKYSNVNLYHHNLITKQLVFYKLLTGLKHATCIHQVMALHYAIHVPYSLSFACMLLFERVKQNHLGPMYT